MDDLQSFTKIAPFLTNPLVLVGFVLMLFFGIHRSLMKSGIIPPLSARFANKVLQTTLRYGFVIALVVIVRGFSWAFFVIYRTPGPTGNATEISSPPTCGAVDDISFVVRQRVVDRNHLAISHGIAALLFALGHGDLLRGPLTARTRGGNGGIALALPDGRSSAELRQQLDHVHAPVGVAPLVVVPGDDACIPVALGLRAQ